ncbi:hypothetical protein [Streptomyces longispororuber]|uniref:hypothetical protein n=1 Tax=Streptomyces longispororuber TaxID=68230 RepID=UPI0036FEB037
MSVLLIGRWIGGTLLIHESHQVEGGDQEAVDELLDRPDHAELWACKFLVDHHDEAVQRAYDQEIRPGTDEDLVDDVAHFEPTR